MLTQRRARLHRRRGVEVFSAYHPFCFSLSFLKGLELRAGPTGCGITEYLEDVFVVWGGRVQLG